MESLDLSIAPPRRPRETCGGVVFLPRSIDKARASLPGGSLGAYRLAGFSEDMLEEIGITVDAFVSAVAAAAHDDDVASFVHANAKPGSIGAWNDYVLARVPFGGEEPERVKELFPFTIERPELKLAVDILEEDDRRAFAG